jgi:hypothetical protein
MPSGTRKSKCTFRGIVAPEPISASELGTAERVIARFVALAYASDHPDLFTVGTDAPPEEPLSSSAVTLVARTALAAEVTQYE